MPSVPGEFDSTYGLDEDAKAAIAAAAADKTKKPDESDEEKEDREREEAERLQAEKDAAAAPAESSVDEAAEHAADADQAEMEATARSMGWVPLDEFRGDKAKWRPAAEWLERGLTNPFILQNLNKRLVEENKRRAAELAEVNKRLNETTEVVRAVSGQIESAARAGYNRAIAEAKARQKEAVGEADQEKFDKAAADLEALEKAGPPKVPTVEKPANGDGREQPFTVEPEIVQWSERNKWFGPDGDLELSEYAAVVDRALQREYAAAGKTEADIGPTAHMEELARRVKKRYADHPAFKTENPRRTAPNSVHSPSGDRGATNGRGNGKPANLQRTYDNLPPDAKAACDRQIKVMGKKKDENGKLVDYYSREKYCETYEWPPEFY